MSHRRWCAVVAVASLYAQSAVANSGNALPRAPAESLSLADANVALVEGPVAQFINPAALDTPTSKGAWAVGSLFGKVSTYYSRPITAGNGAAPAGEYPADDLFPVVPFVALSQRLSDGLNIGVSLDSPNGLGTSWKASTWDVSLGGQPFSIEQKAELTVVRLGPALSWEAGGGWSLGARIFAQYVDALEENDLYKVEANGASTGYQLGLRYRADRFIFGVAYSSRTNTKIDGSISNVNPPATLIPGPASAHILLPDRLQTGVAFGLRPDLWWEIDADWLGWSYVDQLTIVQSDGSIANPAVNVQHNHNTVSFRTGLKWGYKPGLTLQAGLGYDPTPVAEEDVRPTISMLSKIHAALGALYAISSTLRLDLAYQYIYNPTRRISQSNQDNLGPLDTHVFEGDYWSRGHVFGVTLNGRF